MLSRLDLSRYRLFFAEQLRLIKQLCLSRRLLAAGTKLTMALQANVFFEDSDALFLGIDPLFLATDASVAIDEFRLLIGNDFLQRRRIIREVINGRIHGGYFTA